MPMALYTVYNLVYGPWHYIRSAALCLALYILYLAFYMIDFINTSVRDVMSEMIEFS
jgi:hypothetical protein